MITVVLSASPAKLRGHLTRWLMEVSPGVYVGKANSRIREELWSLVKEHLTTGKAILTYSSNTNEQGVVVEVYRAQWQPVDYEGVVMMRHPISTEQGSMKAGWSKASRARIRTRQKRKLN